MKCVKQMDKLFREFSLLFDFSTNMLRQPSNNAFTTPHDRSHFSRKCDLKDLCVTNFINVAPRDRRKNKIHDEETHEIALRLRLKL